MREPEGINNPDPFVVKFPSFRELFVFPLFLINCETTRLALIHIVPAFLLYEFANRRLLQSLLTLLASPPHRNFLRAAQ